MSELSFSIITEDETLEDILFVLDTWNKGFKNFIGNLPSYDPVDLLKYAKDNWWIYGVISDAGLEGVVIYQWPAKRIVNLHVCAFNNKRDWIKFYRESMMPEIAKHADYHLITLKKHERARLRLFEGYGFEFNWDESLNSYKSLQKL